MTWKYVIWRAAPLLLIILLVSYFSGDGWHAFPSALVAWGTILLAFATFSLVQHSKEQEDHRRQEEQAKEKRDRDEHLLDEIIEWAIDVTKCNIKIDIPVILDIKVAYEEQRFKRLLIDEMALSFTAMIGRNQYINTVVMKFEKHLQKAVGDLINDLQAHQKLLDKWWHTTPDKFKSTREEVANHLWQLYKCANNVIEEAAKIKTKDIT